MEYYRLIAVLESQMNFSSLTLRRLLVWTYEPLKRMELIAILLDNTRELKGGALISSVKSFSNHGSPIIRNLINHIMILICKPLFSMIISWILEGELVDPYQEFFVASNENISLERLWFDKYFIRKEMIPSFIDIELANKVNFF